MTDARHGLGRVATVKRWDLRTIAPSTEKRKPREPGPDAPRVPRVGRQMPRVLFSSPECRAVVVDLREGEEMGDHQVRERAVVEVVGGSVEIGTEGETARCGAGTLLTFDPGEQHTVRALDDARLLLILTPWPASKHYTDSEHGEAGHVPANAVVEPL